MGVIRHAEQAARGVSAAIARTKEAKALGADAPGHLATVVAVAKALDVYRETALEVTSSLEGSKDDVIRLTVVGIAADLLARSLPTRADLAPIEPEAGDEIDRATGAVQELLARTLSEGVELKERMVRKKKGEDHAAPDRRAAAC